MSWARVCKTSSSVKASDCGNSPGLNLMLDPFATMVLMFGALPDITFKHCSVTRGQPETSI